MIRYLWLSLFKTISAEKAVRFFNTSNATRNKKVKILKKAGIKFNGRSNIKSPFYFETGNITFGNRVFLNVNCVFLDNAQITIGDKTMMGPGVKICTPIHDVNSEDRAAIKTAPINIGNNVWIGAGAVILPGVTIGDNSVIGANSVVNCDVPENCLYAGVPAKFKKPVNVKQFDTKPLA